MGFVSCSPSSISSRFNQTASRVDSQAAMYLDSVVERLVHLYRFQPQARGPPSSRNRNPVVEPRVSTSPA